MSEIDRELLELAAKAAGMNGYRWTGSCMSKMINPNLEASGSIGPGWNPLADDGDAFRLMVRLRIGFRYEVNSPPELRIPRECATAVVEGRWYAEAPKCGDEDAATRRSIVRAAAEIGRRMK